MAGTEVSVRQKTCHRGTDRETIAGDAGEIMVTYNSGGELVIFSNVNSGLHAAFLLQLTKVNARTALAAKARDHLRESPAPSARSLMYGYS